MNRRLDMALRLTAFVLTVVLAVARRWEARDLIWGLWASSLSFGTTYGLLLIACNPAEVDAPRGWRSPGRMLALMAFLVFVLGLFHLFQGIVLEMVFPLTGDGGPGRPIFEFPLRAFGAYRLFVVGAFASRGFELVAATRPSDDPQRLLAPFRQIAVMQVMVFLFMIMAAAGVIRFAVYPILVAFYLPGDDVVRTARGLIGKWTG